MKKIIIYLFVICATVGAKAQSKMSSEITRMLNHVEQQIAESQRHYGRMSHASAVHSCPVDTAAIKKTMVVSFNADGTVRTVDVIAILAEGAACPTSALEAKGIRVKDQVRKFVFLVVPADQLEYLETLEEFDSLMENPVYQTMTDNTRRLTNVSDINGIDIAPYTFATPYTGKGVVIGIVDTGIDYNHIVFKDSEGKTRVKKVVNYSGENSNADVVTNPEDIATLITDRADLSHGTHVACCAVGSVVDATIDYSTGTRRLGGMAPEADIVLCGAYLLTGDHVAKSVEEIVKTAKELNEPCVINFSFGLTGSWHDGNNATNLVINEYAKEGVIFCMSTANSAYTRWTVDKSIPAGGYLKFIPRKNIAISSSSIAYIPSQEIAIHLPQCTDPNAVSYSFEVVDSLTGAVTTLTETPLLDVTGEPFEPSITFKEDAFHHNWVRGTVYLSWCYFNENSKFLVVKVQNKTTSDLRAYAMSNRKVNGEYPENLACTVFPNYEYDKGTADVSMNNACGANNLISVGAYTFEPKMTGYNGKTYSASPGSAMIARIGEANSTAAYSSYGRDDFGKMHPDVIAPGTFLVSAYNQYDTSVADVKDKKTWTDQYICAYLTDSNNKTHLFYRDQGTSMATPVVSGIIALWLQACPTLTAEKVREIIQYTSHTSVDNEAIHISAGDTPQNALQLGYGFIDAKAGMQYVLEKIVPTAISDISNDVKPTDKTVKKIIDGKIIIEKNGKRYNTVGQEVIY